MADAEPPKYLRGDEKPEGDKRSDSAKKEAPAASPPPQPPAGKPKETFKKAAATENKKPPAGQKAAAQPAAPKPAPEIVPVPEKEEAKKKDVTETPAAETKPADAKKEDPAKEAAPAAKTGNVEEAVKVGATEATAEEVAEAEKKGVEKKKSLKVKVFEKGVDVAGFGDILKAWRSPENRLRNVLKSVGSKLADMVAGRIVSMTFRMIAITWVAGIIGGVSTFGGLALLALATGTASALYTYSKDYLHDKLYGPKEKRKDVKFFDKLRLRNAGISFLTGSLTGALGAWLAKTGIVQNVFNAFFGAADAGKEAISDVFNSAAGKIEGVIMPESPATAPLVNSFGATLHPVEPAVESLIPAPVPQLIPAPGFAGPRVP